MRLMSFFCSKIIRHDQRDQHQTHPLDPSASPACTAPSPRAFSFDENERVREACKVVHAPARGDSVEVLSDGVNGISRKWRDFS